MLQMDLQTLQDANWGASEGSAAHIAFLGGGAGVSLGLGLLGTFYLLVSLPCLPAILPWHASSSPDELLVV